MESLTYICTMYTKEPLKDWHRQNNIPLLLCKTQKSSSTVRACNNHDSFNTNQRCIHTYMKSNVLCWQISLMKHALRRGGLLPYFYALSQTGYDKFYRTSKARHLTMCLIMHVRVLPCKIGCFILFEHRCIT